MEYVKTGVQALGRHIRPTVVLTALVILVAGGLIVGCGGQSSGNAAPPADMTSRETTALPTNAGEDVMRVHYLEIVTTDVDGVCAVYAAANGLQFGEPVPELGNARTAARPGGGLVGVRAPMRETEDPVVRPYWLVDDIEAAMTAAAGAGAEIAHPPLEVPGVGTFAIYIQGGVQHGLWQR